MAGFSHNVMGVTIVFMASVLWIWMLRSLDIYGSFYSLTYNSCSCDLDLTSASPASDTSTHLSGSNIASLPLPTVATKSRLASSPFPAKLWQKSGPGGMSKSREHYVKSWQQMNTNLRHEILTDGSADQYVRDVYASFPTLVNLFLSLQVPSMKVDLFRQLVLFAEGGVWSDLDVTCLKPVDYWIPEPYKNRTNVVVGLDSDESQFASWTVMAKPRTSHFAATIRYTVAALAESARRYNTTIPGLEMHAASKVVEVTGARAMTVAILRNLAAEMGVSIGRDNLTDLREPLLLQDVLILPNAAFAAMKSGRPEDRGPYLVEHYYAKSDE